MRLGKTLNLELLRDAEEGAEVVLGDVNLAPVHEVQQRDQVPVPHPLQEEERVMVPGVPEEDVPEEGGAGREHDLVGLHLTAILGDEAHVEQLLLLPEIIEGCAEVLLVVIPF